MEKVPKDIYSHCVRIAKSYYTLLTRRGQIEREILYASAAPPAGMPRGSDVGKPTESTALRLIRKKDEIDRKIGAIQRALEFLPGEVERAFIRKNLFERVPMIYIDAPISERTGKRIRAAYIQRLAMELDEF